MIKESCIYTGKVVHKRFKPKEHFFKYKVFSILLDLNEIKFISKNINFFSYNKFNLMSFYDKDHGPRDGSSLTDWVKLNLKSVGINNEEIKIKILCYPRILGYVFNPLSIFFVYNSKSKLISHTYVFKVDEKSELLKNNCEKKFFVSPFMDLESEYYFKVLNPDKSLSIIIDQRDKSGKLLFASQDGVRSNLNSKNLIFSYLKHPLMTFKIISAIHFEALRLWLKGIKLVKKKVNIKNNISFEK